MCMDWRSFLYKGILRGGICILLSAAIILGLVLPGMDMQHAQPEDPLTDDSIQDITVLSVGENISELNTIVVPNGGSTPPTEPNETNPEETDLEETEPNPTIPQETESEDPDINEGEEGNEDQNQGADGGAELELDLAAVMTWYRYGNEAKTLTCSPAKAVAKTVNTAQLVNNELKYEIALTGSDARYVKITSVSVAEGDSAYREVNEKGKLEIHLPGGTGDRKYTFQVNALAEKKDENGDKVQQEVQFHFVIKCEYFMDLELELVWQEKDGRNHTVTCKPDKAEAFSVQNYELNERTLSFTAKLTGALSDRAKIVDAKYTTASGQYSGNLGTDKGSMILKPTPGSNKETYYLTFTVETPDRTVLYTYNLFYQEMLDVQLSFTWKEKGIIDHSMTCQPDGIVSDQVRNNQLSAGAVLYEMEIVGKDSGDSEIMTVSYTSDVGSGSLNASGSLPMEMPSGGTTNTYRLTVNAMVKGQRMTFHVVLYYANDVTLQMEYTVKENGMDTPRFVACENKKSTTAEAIYDDQLWDGLLEYRMTIAGSDSDNVSITSVTCFQSGNNRTTRLNEAGEIKLLLDDNKTGENTFEVIAQDDSGNTYSFTINIPYKHRGENNIKIETNLRDGQTIINAAKTNLTVKAWSEDGNGNVLDYIPATGVDTKLIVKLDDVELSYVSTSGASSEYDLYPENPVVGDTNEHVLYIYAEDAYGNHGELELKLIGQRRQSGQLAGNATIRVDMSVLGLGVVETLSYEILADEPVSYVIVKALMGEELPQPYGKAKESLGWNGSYAGTLDTGFYLQSLTTGHSASALEGSTWPSDSEAETLAEIDRIFGKGSGLATLWRCIRRNGLNKSSGSGGTFGEFDYTSGSGWMYSIGGRNYYPGQSMSAVYLQDGDVLTIRYTLAYGWDVGGGDPAYGTTVGYCVSAINGNFEINHRMKTEIRNGQEVYICQCCGIEEDCSHQNAAPKDLGYGAHILYCEDCDTTIGSAQDHIWDLDGYADVHTCTECGAQEEHLWEYDEFNRNPNPPTCTTDGYINEYCVVCYAGRENVPAPATGHYYSNTVYPDKYEHYWQCETCGQEAERGRHEFVYTDEWMDFECWVCGAAHDQGMTGCDGYMNVVQAESTCTRLLYYCSDCGYSAEQTGSFAEYHNYQNGYCTYCGSTDPNYNFEPDSGGDSNADPEGGDDEWDDEWGDEWGDEWENST